jgi:hypothetical protein
MYSGNPIQYNTILIGYLCVFLIAFSKLNLNVKNTLEINFNVTASDLDYECIKFNFRLSF